MLIPPKLIENIYLTIPGPVQMVHREINRTWKERLFSWPWKPLTKKKWITEKFHPQYPDPNVYYLDDGKTIMAHPLVIQQLKELLKKENFDAI